MPAKRGSITVTHGRGVMSKDGTTPFAAGTIMAIRPNGMSFGCTYSPTSVAILLNDDDIREIRIIDADNIKSIITKNWIDKQPSRLGILLAQGAGRD